MFGTANNIFGTKNIIEPLRAFRRASSPCPIKCLAFYTKSIATSMSVSHFSSRVFELVLSDVCLFLSNVSIMFGRFLVHFVVPKALREHLGKAT